MSKGIKRQLRMARKRVNDRIARQTDRDNLFSRGLAPEGYLGGYRDALDDVELALNGIKPNRNWDYNLWALGKNNTYQKGDKK